MKRIKLLSIAIIASLATIYAGDVFDNAYWIIKNGKISSGISIMHYKDEEAGNADQLVETTVNGVDAVEFRKTSNWLDPRYILDSLAPLDLNTNYIMFLEYMIPANHAGTTYIDGNKPTFIIGLATDEKNMEADNAPNSEAVVYIDTKWGPTEQWVQKYKYVYAYPSMDTIRGMIISYVREYGIGDMQNFPYIKNLCFIPTADNVKPFYAENFTNRSICNFYSEKSYIHRKSKKQLKNEQFNGGIKPVVTEKDSTEALLYAFRDFVPDSLRNTDGSGYLDCEILQAMRIESAAVRDSVVIPGIQIPAGTSQIFSEMLIKKYKNEDGASIDEDFSTVANVDMPIKLKFNTGEIVDLARDTMKMIWTKYKGVVNVPAGATSADLIFCPMSVGYLVDEIILSSTAFVNVKDFLEENNHFEIISYVDAEGNIIVLNGELQAVYNMNGAIANKNDKVVVILVKNDEGKLASKIILRK
ncbi:MAG: hypothetical protein IJ916_12495 [Paludibacteraceae bacterium]|nr:hypothetical protein [Paludibacteraceae bacterium]